MKKELAIFFGIIVLAAISLYIINSYGILKQRDADREISFDEFKQLINSQERFSVVMYTQGPEYKNRAVINCAIGIAGSLGRLGKAVSNYGIENNYCLWQEPEKSELRNTSIGECSGEFEKNYYFKIMYGSNSTKFYSKKTVIYVNENFTGECSFSAKAP